MVVSLGVEWSKRKLFIGRWQLFSPCSFCAELFLAKEKMCELAELKKAFLWWVLSPGRVQTETDYFQLRPT